MTEGLHQEFKVRLDPELGFTISGSNTQIGGKKFITTNNLLNETDDRGIRKEQGTNGTIDVNSYILDEIQEFAQSPIIPNSTGSNAIKRKSNELLGNVVNGRKSRIYYSERPLGNVNHLILNPFEEN